MTTPLSSDEIQAAVTIECCHVCDTPKVSGTGWMKCANLGCAAFDVPLASASYRKFVRAETLLASRAEVERLEESRKRLSKLECDALEKYHAERQAREKAEAVVEAYRKAKRCPCGIDSVFCGGDLRKKLQVYEDSKK